LGGVFFYFLLLVYLHQLEAYLEHPGGGNASRILGIAGFGSLVMLFLHSQLTSAVAGLLMKGGRRSFLGIYSHEWRLFVANLQMLLIVCAYGCVVWTAHALANWLDLPPLGGWGLKLLLLAILFWMLVRAWFFLLPLCASTGEGETLLRSWQASRRHFWKIAGLLLLLGLVVAFANLLLQLLLGPFNVVPPLPGAMSIAAAIDMYQALLLPFVLLTSGTYLLAVILTTVGRIRLYQEVTGSANSRHES
jgi:hypothetical protein